MLTEPVTIVGDSLLVLPTLEADTFDAVITDPPYSSGGLMRSDVQQSTGLKYGHTSSTRVLPDFTGDSRPQLAYQYWATLWMADCLRVTRAGGWLMVCSDWRQIAPTILAVEAAGWVYRGIVVWAKPGGRPIPNRFRSSAEFVITATNGAHEQPAGDWSADAGVAYPEGVWEGSAPPDRVHVTQKPVELMRHLMSVLPAGADVLDPFAGSGTTGEAGYLEGHKVTLIDISDRWMDYASDRVAQGALFPVQTPGTR